MTQKEMKMTFREFLKYHKPDYASSSSVHWLPEKAEPPAIIDETKGEF